MSSASSSIERLEIELTVPSVGIGHELSDRLAALRGHGIEPLLDRLCRELSPSGQMDCFERLELDLGALSSNRFDEDFLRELEVAFRAAVSRALVAQPRARTSEGEAMDILESYVRTGNLPWWADAKDPAIVGRALTRALLETPAAFIALVRAVADDTRAAARIARHCRDPRAVRALRALVASNAGARGGASAPSSAREERRPSSVDDRGPEETGESIRQLVASLFRAATHGDAEGDPAGGTATPRTPPFAMDRAARAEVRGPDAIAPSPSLHEEAWPTGSRRSRADTKADPRPRLLDRDTLHHVDGPTPLPSRAGPWERRKTRERRDGIPAAARHSEYGASAEPHDDVATGSVTASESTISIRDQVGRAPVETPSKATLGANRRAFSKLEQLYVENAGVVVLWPLLARLFERVGVIDHRRGFAGPDERMLAIALLDFLATSDPDPPEPRLALAKLLCGLAPDALFALDLPLPAEAMAECAYLIRALLDQVPQWKSLSPSAFRESFLMRAGTLEVSAGAWLLRVERRPQDILLERLSWSWSWVKLSWMADPLRVEW